MKLKTKFQDEDFDLGEVVEGVIVECLGKHEEELRVIATAAKGGQHTFYYSSIKKFMDDWEDVVEEPKGIKEIFFTGATVHIAMHNQKEAIEMEEKLKAWTRLKDKGFRFEGIKQNYIAYNPLAIMENGRKYLQFNKSEDEDWLKENWDDLKLLFFGGEE